LLGMSVGDVIPLTTEGEG